MRCPPNGPPAQGACIVALIAAVVLTGAAAAAEAPRLRAGAIEVGLSGSLTSVEGSRRSILALRAGSFLRAFSGLAVFEAEVGYHHQRSLDEVELQGAVAWQHALGRSAIHPFVALGGGVRQEWLGSFSEARYPVGFALGVRALFDVRAAMRVEYRYRRVFRDPVADFTEHEALVGLSLLFRNDVEGPPPGGGKER